VDDDLPVRELLDVLDAVVPSWLRRCVERAVTAAGRDVAELESALTEMVDREAPRIVAQLEQLLMTDVDEQRSNPLSVLRAAIAAPTALLEAYGVPALARDRFASESFPDDVYGLGPATWSDVDDRLAEPGVVWGAWKAMTVLRRRRGEGA
jgi:hypothetical protein